MFETVVNTLVNDQGLLGLLLAGSLLLNGFLLRRIFSMYEDNRKEDKNTMEQLFEALSLLRSVREDILRKGSHA